jgi:hypothetical protein
MPTISAITYNEANSSVDITFNRLLYKGSGEIVITQSSIDFRVPAVLSKSKFDELYNAADTADRAILANSYRWGTNGAKADGSPDLDGKYILHFGLNTNNPAVVSAYQNAGGHQIRLPINSSSAVINGQVLQCKVQLAVRGASYSITIPSALVVDALGQPNAADASNTVLVSGVEAPVIRIEKRSETLARTAVGNPVRAIQSMTAQVKMDCTTPGVSIRYTVASVDYAMVGLDENLTTTTRITNPPVGAQGPAPEPTNPTLISTLYATPFNIGNAASTITGQKFRIKAIGFKSGSSSELAQESAFRSILRFNNNRAYVMPDYAGGNLNGTVPAGSNDSSNLTSPEQLWVRGGDGISGSTLTPGFPLAWDPNNLQGVRLMSALDASNWYWVTWEVTATAYVTLLWGTTPYNPNEAINLAEAQMGPWRWGWLKNGYTPFKEYFALYPGECRELVTAGYGTVDGIGRGDIQFGTAADGGVQFRPGVY